MQSAADSIVRVQGARSSELKVLLFAYYFPPFSGGATARVHGFTKYLPQFGVIPQVLTVKPEFYEQSYVDPQQLSSYDERIKIRHSRVLFGRTMARMKTRALTSERPSPGSPRGGLRSILKRLLLPDEQVAWLLPGTLSALRAIREDRPDVLLSTAPPVSTHLLAAIVSRLTGIPLVLDYRDLWTHGAGQRTSRGLERLERWIIASAQRIVLTNDAAAEAMRPIALQQMSVIPNGFDFESSSIGPPRGVRPQYFVHLGSLTKKRTPVHFLNALRDVLERRPDLPLRARFVGYAPTAHRELAANMGLSHRVEFVPEVDRTTALQELTRADVLLVFQRESEGGSTAIPGKIYEYLASGRPILAMDEGSGATTQFLSSRKWAHCSAYSDVQDIAKAIELLNDDYPAQAQRAAWIAEEAQRFHRRNLSSELSAVLMQTARQEKR